MLLRALGADSMRDGLTFAFSTFSDDFLVSHLSAHVDDVVGVIFHIQDFSRRNTSCISFLFLGGFP